MAVIYRLCNNRNRKSYIGFTTDLDARMGRHQRSSRTADTKFSRAIRKYGWDSFELSVLYESPDEDFTLEFMEPYFIRQYNTFHEGYNSDLGGRGVVGAVRNRVWINDGQKSLRVYEDDIPEGWEKGRVTFTRTIRPKWKSDRKKRRSYKGADNPTARGVIGPDGEYPTRKAAAQAMGVNHSTISYWIKTKKEWTYSQ